MLRPVSVSAWPYRRGRNPYTTHLHDAMVESGRATVREYDLLRSWAGSAQIVHVHWPDRAVHGRSTVRAAVRTAVFLLGLLVLRIRGARVVWTCHNLQSHESHRPTMERLMWWCFTRLVDGVHHMTDASVEMSVERFPALRGAVHGVAPHGSYPGPADGTADRGDARRRLGVPEGVGVLAFVGTLRPHKAVVELVTAFRATDGDALLLVAGAPDDEALADRVRAAALGDDRVDLRLRWLEEAEMRDLVVAADMLVLPYREFHNSGVVLLALSLGRPVAVPRTAVTEELAARVGAGWLHLLPSGVLDAAAVRELLDVPPPEGAPDLSSSSWGQVADEVLATYAALDGVVVPPPGQTAAGAGGGRQCG